ncbi:energy-coupling factor ABC transporter ATP-binding protein [Luteococcus sp. OSA5]|uniref:energy-coupling factor ABC transporter ATP-binding protein n=1 Tax=Luteococcus sp. OSA5 TaxID=3401630 RepID=UPI003B42DEBA
MGDGVPGSAPATPAPVAPALSAVGLEADHGGPPVLRQATIEVPAGSRMALLGANGSGKTTLLRCLSGALAPTAGTVCVAGQAMQTSRSGLRRRRRLVQLVLQDPDDQLFSADVTQDVSFGPMNLGLSEAEVQDRVAQALSLLGISHLADRPTHHLSYGERKRVATAGAVAMRPQVLLLDEPTAGLDPVGVHEMLDSLEQLLAGGTTVLLATHDVDLALAWADHAAVVLDGRVHQGPAPRLLADAELLRAARLHRPWPLELAARLGLSRHGPPEAAPRHLDDIVALLQGSRKL